jgi:hypothetical protein
MARWLGAVACVGAVAFGCGDDAGKDDDGGWGGEVTHLRAEGSVDGEKVSLDLDAAAVAENELHCELEYTAPALEGGMPDYANGRLNEIKIEGFVTVDDEKRGLEIELKMHDFQGDEPGTKVKVVPRSDTKPPAATEAWLEWEWHDAVSDEELYQAAASAGTITVELFDGEVDDTGLVIPTGRIGISFSGRWSETEEMTVSFTLPCTEAEVVVEE